MTHSTSGLTTAPDSMQAQVSFGLNLWLELEDPARMPELLSNLLDARDSINLALERLHYVHFARFVPIPGHTALQVITAFDGDFRSYVLDFVLAIGPQFEMIMGYVKNRPAAPVMDHPADFLRYIDDHNLGWESTGGGGISLFSSYPTRTVIDINGAGGMAPRIYDATAVSVDRRDVQANVLRGVGALHALFVPLRIGTASGAGALLDEILTGGHGAPRLSNDADRPSNALRPPYWLTIALSFEGLKTLGISSADRDAFTLAHPAFCRGPDAREAAIAAGDVGTSQPALWKIGGAHPLDLLVSLYADDAQELQTQSDALLARCSVHGLAVVHQPWRADVLLDEGNSARKRVHFGYVDGLSQPRLAITDAAPGVSDMQPLAGVGEFLLGKNYPNVFGGTQSLGPLSTQLAENATFAALRIMEQDTAGFEALLDRASARYGLDREWLAAKLLGRWRDGTPVSQSPDAPLPEPGAPARNQFDYRPSVDHPMTPDDSAGLRCPLGAHVRRMNPRSAVVAGRPHSRRLLRRGMPYGAPFEAGNPDDGLARGLVGLFLCADLERQFEFSLRQWAQGDRATIGLVGQQDPIIGSQATLLHGHTMSGHFRIADSSGGDDILLELPRLVKTVGSTYVFMPGLAGVRHLASLASAVAGTTGLRAVSFTAQLRAYRADLAFTAIAATPTATAAAPIATTAVPPDPATFDPRDMDFRANPFDSYAWFRDNHPMVELPQMNSIWLFSHRLVAMVAADPELFRKRRSGTKSPAGLLNMDPPAHTGCRAAVAPLFAKVLAAVAPRISTMASSRYASHCRGKGGAVPLDWMAQFAQPVAQHAFLEHFGLTVAQASGFVDKVEAVLAMATPADDPATNAAIEAKLAALGPVMFLSLQRLCKPGRMFSALLGVADQDGNPFDQCSNQARPPATALKVEQLTNAITLGLAGFLPLQWFIALATWRLLQDGARLLRQIKADPAIANRAVVDELLRFDMSAPVSDRYVQSDTDIDGVILKKDQRLTLAWSSANHDAQHFGADAESINFSRGTAGPGWAFGADGQRNCLGRELVYVVMEPVIQTLRDADPVPRLADGFEPAWGTPTEGAMFRAMAVLMVHS